MKRSPRAKDRCHSAGKLVVTSVEIIFGYSCSTAFDVYTIIFDLTSFFRMRQVFESTCREMWCDNECSRCSFASHPQHGTRAFFFFLLCFIIGDREFLTGGPAALRHTCCLLGRRMFFLLLFFLSFYRLWWCDKSGPRYLSLLPVIAC